MTRVMNSHIERQRLRNISFFNPDVTPVLLLYWTPDELLSYLIPASQDVLSKLKAVNGIICNKDSQWVALSDTFDYIEKMRFYFDESKGIIPGPWTRDYFIDTWDEDGNELPAINLPPGTVVVQTGCL